MRRKFRMTRSVTKLDALLYTHPGLPTFAGQNTGQMNNSAGSVPRYYISLNGNYFGMVFICKVSHCLKFYYL